MERLEKIVEKKKYYEKRLNEIEKEKIQIEKELQKLSLEQNIIEYIISEQGENYPQIGSNYKNDHYDNDLIYIDINSIKFIGDRAFIEANSVNNKNYLFVIKKGINFSDNKEKYEIEMLSMLDSNNNEVNTDYHYLTDDSIIIKIEYHNDSKKDYYVVNLRNRYFMDEYITFYTKRLLFEDEGKKLWESSLERTIGKNNNSLIKTLNR